MSRYFFILFKILISGEGALFPLKESRLIHADYRFSMHGTETFPSRTRQVSVPNAALE
jgi:hypothetical protein